MGNHAWMRHLAAATVILLTATPFAYSADSVQSGKLTNQGYALLQSGDERSAIQYFAKAVTADPNNLTARRLYARAQLQSGCATECINQLRVVATVQALQPADLVMLGQACMSMSKTGEAEAHFNRAMKAEPANATAALGLIDCYVATGRYSQATVLCKHVMSTSKTAQSVEQATQKLTLIEQCSQKPEPHLEG